MGKHKYYVKFNKETGMCIQINLKNGNPNPDMSEFVEAPDGWSPEDGILFLRDGEIRIETEKERLEREEEEREEGRLTEEEKE